jgi:hypothetical protein
MDGFFSSIVKSLKAMSLTPHTCSKLKSFDYGAIKIEFVNCLPTKFNGDILFELRGLFTIYWDIMNNYKSMARNMMVMLGVNYR